MNPRLFRQAPRAVRGAFRIGALVAALGVAAPGLRAQAGAPDTPPAVVERPLAPAANDTPDVQPSPLHVWVPGHWRWSQGSYAWVTGEWQVPPVPTATWFAPQWVQQGNGFVLREGFWQQPPPVNGASQGGETWASQPPPPPRPETISERPAPNFVWLPGYWDFRDNQFRWVEGRWDVPPRPNVTWIGAHWEARGDRFVLVPGYWRELVVAQPPSTVVPTPPPQPPVTVVQQPAPPPQVVVVGPPPPPRTEVVYSRPSPYHIWVSGYWAWQGNRYVWIGGHWERPPRGRHSWVEPRWEHRGGSYVFIQGHWR